MAKIFTGTTNAKLMEEVVAYTLGAFMPDLDKYPKALPLVRLIVTAALDEAEKRGMERALAAVEGLGNDVYWTKDEYMYWAKDAIKTKIKKV